MSILPQTPRRRGGGCFSGCLQIIGVLVLGCVLILALWAVFEPWGFYLGGRFHPFGYWQGWGTIHAPEGDYVVLMRMSPWTRGRSTFPSLSGPGVSGAGAVCSPHGEVYGYLRLRGGFVNHKIGTNTDGQPMNLSLTERLNMLGTNGDTRLNLGFRGTWHNPDFVLDERGSIRRMFNADGSRYTGDPHKRPGPGTPLQFTLHEGSRSDFDAACAAAKRR